MAAKRRTRKKKSRRSWLLIPLVILAVILGWLYRDEIVGLATFQFDGIDFTRRPAPEKQPAPEKPLPPSPGGITDAERKELEKILQDR